MPRSHVHRTHRGGAPPSEAAVQAISQTMQALATPSRVRLLYLLLEGERAVGELAKSASVTPAAASQQLRILRHLGLVTAGRAGQSVRYRLHDEHVATLLDEIRNHVEHAERARGALAA
jgi:DNA-binding transcriptional ArsR family regulator